MVAAHRTGQASGDADGQQRRRRIEHGHDDGDQDAERAPARARRERQEQRHQEDDGGQHGVQAFGGTGQRVMHEHVGAQRGGRQLQRQGEGEDEHGRNHGLEALDEAVRGFLEVHDAANEQVDEREHDGDKRAPRQADRRVGVAESDHDVAEAVSFGIPETAHVQHADDAAHDQHDDGKQQVDQRGLALLDGLLVAERPCLAVAEGGQLGLRHGAVVEAHDADADDEHDGQQRVEVVRDGLDEQLDARHARVEVACRGGHGGGPRRDGGDHADGGCGCVDDVRQLRA